MRITDIEVYPITLEFNDRHADALMHFHGSSGLVRSIFIVHTDNGLQGLGEGRATPEVVERYIGTNPCD